MRRLFVEGLALVEPHFSGIGHYTANILGGMDRLAAAAKLNRKPFPEIHVIIPKGTEDRYRSFGYQYLQYKTFPTSMRIMSGLHHRSKLPPLDLIFGKGVYLFTRFADMPLMFSKSLVVVYDLTFEMYKEYTEDRNQVFLSKTVHKSISRAAGVIAISENSRNEIINFYKLKPSFVTVATPAVDRQIFYRQSPQTIERIKRKYGIEGDYILFVGNLEPRKNIDGLVKAYAKLPRAITDKYSLLLVGVNGWKTEGTIKTIVSYYRRGYKIIRPSNYVRDADIPAIYSGASLLAFPSHYEGFGIPLIEALACGTPVVAANNSSLPEVVGDCGQFANDNNTNEIAKVIEKVIKDTKFLEKIQRDGPKQATKFSWESSAQTIIDRAIRISK